jgi:hypothetical protein
MMIQFHQRLTKLYWGTWEKENLVNYHITIAEEELVNQPIVAENVCIFFRLFVKP